MRKLLLLLLLPLWSFSQLVIQSEDGKTWELPKGKYTLTVGTPVEPPKPTLPNCGCNNADFSIISITKREGAKYEVQFDACNVSPLTWEVGGKSDSFKPTSSAFTADLTGLADGEYTFKISSPNCTGKAEKRFRIESGNTSPPPSSCQWQNDGLECIWLGGLDGILSVGTALVGGEKKAAIDNWFADGGSAVQITADWGELELAEGVYNPQSINKFLAVLNYLRSKQMKAYVKLQMSISRLSCINGCPSHIYSIPEDAVRTTGGLPYQNGAYVPMSLSSPKLSNMVRFWSMMAKTLEPYKDMIFVAVTTEPNQEMQYVIDAPTDYSTLEEEAFRKFQLSAYSNVAGGQPSDFNGEIGKRWMKFKSAQLTAFAKKWGNIFTNAGFSTIYDCGSFSDGIIWRGNWGVPTEALKPEISGLKDNPDFWGGYDIPLIAGLTSSYSSLSMLETTFNPMQDVGANVGRIVEELRKARESGIRIINFSFFSNYHDTGSPNYQTGKQVLAKLKELGLLGRRQICPELTTMILKASTALQSGGYMAAYSSAYKAMREQNAGTKVGVKVVNDL